MRIAPVPTPILTTANPIRRQRTPAVRCLALSLLAALLCTASVYEPVVNLVFLGDIMLGRGVAEAHAGGDWDSTLRAVQLFTRSADLALANLESPLACGSPVSADSRSLAAPPDGVAALSSAGLDVLSTVNNHALDAGEEGSRCTRETLAAHGILALAAPSGELEISVKGMDILFLALNLVDEASPGDLTDLERRIRAADQAGKTVVVSLHWGMEYQSGRDSLQLRIARALADSHADILWGHHPHAVQETEWIGNTLVFYSLGNAVFDQYEPETARHGELAWVEVDRRGPRRAWILPFTIDPRLGKINPPSVFSIRLLNGPPSSA
jgi:poly-gamma-glutamate capsule biosynthesis protein CapA/YwtB (metallophosphatase superfamily)